MDKLFSNKSVFRKMIIYTSATMLFITVPALPASAAENAQAPGTTAEIPAQQESQPASANTPTEDGNPASTDNVPVQDTQTPAPQLPADGAGTTPQLPTDAATDTPLPEPAPVDQGGIAVTPMQSIVYAASPKGLNVRSGPSTSHSKLGTLKYGEAITVTGVTADNWYQIQYAGNVGYIRADYVSAAPLTTESPAPAAPAAENPPAESPAASNTDMGIPDNGDIPDEPHGDEDDELQTEEDSFTGNTAVIGHLIGTPVFIVLGLAVVGVMALIGYSVYGLFKKDDAADEYYEGEYYEDEQYADGEYYEDEQYPDDGYYENEQYPDDVYYENGQYADGEYYEDEDEYYSDDKYYEDVRYSNSDDDEYYENEQYSDSEYH